MWGVDRRRWGRCCGGGCVCGAWWVWGGGCWWWMGKLVLKGEVEVLEMRLGSGKEALTLTLIRLNLTLR